LFARGIEVVGPCNVPIPCQLVGHGGGVLT